MNLLYNKYIRKRKRRHNVSNTAVLNEISEPLIEAEVIHIEPPNIPISRSNSLFTIKNLSLGIEEILLIGLIVILLIEGCNDMLLIFALIYILVF
jgi:hypothetical protein